MKFDLFTTLIDQARGFITSYVAQLRGEPLVHPRFGDMIEYVRHTVPSASIWFNTNGLLLTPALTDRLLRTGVNGIYFSIDAATEETYGEIRIGSNFAVVMQNIEYLLAVRSEGRGSIRPEIGVSFVLQDRNRHEKKPFLKKWLRTVDRVQFYTLVEMDRRRPVKFFKPKGPRTPCKSLWNSVAVLTDGTVVPCCGDLTPVESLGNVRQTSLEEIISGGRYLELRRLHVAGEVKSIPLCRECDTWMAYEARSHTMPGSGVTLSRNPLSESWMVR